MKKIQCLFKRDYSKNNRPIIDEVLEGSEWVVKGEGIATRKFDGTCCLIKKGKLFKRYTLKKGKVPPLDFVSVTEIDKITGKQFGWRPVNNNDKYHIEAFIKLKYKLNGTYELCGPKINGNKEKLNEHILIKHGIEILYNVPLDFNRLNEYLYVNNIEGIVWYSYGGKMVKIKGIDFGIKRK